MTRTSHEPSSSARVSAVRHSSAESSDEPRLVLHARMTNLYFVMIFLAVVSLVSLAEPMFEMWRGQRDPSQLGLVAAIAVLLVGGIAYYQKKARWLIARPSGLAIIERKGIRVVPWRDVRVIDDLGYWGGGPAAKRYYIEFSDGDYFTFLGDPEQMLRLKHQRDGWTALSRAERSLGEG